MVAREASSAAPPALLAAARGYRTGDADLLAYVRAHSRFFVLLVAGLGVVGRMVWRLRTARAPVPRYAQPSSRRGV